MQLHFSFIIPVYNRPEEIKELLESFTLLEGDTKFEIVIVEDGSTTTSKTHIENYSSKLDISYYYKKNSGPGDSRNYGMKKAKGNYFIILDSDCVLPKQYLKEVLISLKDDYVDCFGGPDAAHESFTSLQKAINYSMTAFITTGGIRGHEKSIDKFQPRSFNMGLSKEAFEVSNGFARVHPGEDPDLTIRLWKKGYRTKLIPKAFVYHKRRISWFKFHTQLNKFGKVRPILNQWHPKTRKITYWFPSVFVLCLFASILFAFFKMFWLLAFVLAYYFVVLILAIIETKSISVGFQSLIALTIQFYSYGVGFLKSMFMLKILKKKPEEAFPKLFFNL